MNHKPKFSLILLIPFSTFASQTPEQKTTRGVVFIPGKPNAFRSDKTPIKDPSESSTDDIASKLPDASAPNNTTTNPASVAAAPAASAATAATATVAAAVAKAIEGNDNELGAAYRRIPATEQKATYAVGKDGIAKLTRLENSDTFIARLLRDGKFADAANHTKDSFLPDHLRRAVESKQESLISRSTIDKQTILDLLRKQRESNATLFTSIFPLLDAITKHTPRQVTLDTIDAFQQKIRGIQVDKQSVLATMTKEISEQNSFLEDLVAQLEALRKAQSSESQK